MAIRCPSCDQPILEEELPRLEQSAHVLCPQCREPLTLPEMTIPLSVADPRHTPRSEGGLDPSKKYALLVVAGAETGRIIDIEQESVTIGRSGCDILLDDPEISRRHAQIQVEGVRAVLEDLESTNGTYFDGQRIERVTLENRAKFRVGSHELAFVVTEQSS